MARCYCAYVNDEILSQHTSVKSPRGNCVLGVGFDIWAAKVRGFGLDHEALAMKTVGIIDQTH